AQNAVDIACRLSRLIDKVSAVGHQTARRDKKTERTDRRQAVPSGECDDKVTVLDRGTRQHDKTAVRLTRQGLYCTLEPAVTADVGKSRRRISASQSRATR